MEKLSDFLEHERQNNSGKPLNSYGVNSTRAGESGLDSAKARFDKVKTDSLGKDPGDIGGPDNPRVEGVSTGTNSPELNALYIKQPIATVILGNRFPTVTPGYRMVKPKSFSSRRK